MKTILPNISMRQAALIAGVAILLMTLAAVIATDLAIGPLIVQDNPTLTFENIKSHQLQFRIGVLSWVVVLICDVVAAWGLYIFLSPVNKGISLLSAWLRIVYTALLGTSILKYTTILELLDSEYYLTAFGAIQIEAQTWSSLNGFDASWSIGLIVFGLHIFLIGYLGLKSKYVPKLLSIFLLIGFLGYTMIHLSSLLIPQYQTLIEVLGWIFILPILSEVALGLWLLVKGKDIQNDQLR